MNVLGIDFGTTHTAAAYIDEGGHLVPVPVGEGRYTLPSIVWFGGEGEHRVVGRLARPQIVEEPQHTIFGFKRFLGLAIDSPFVSRHRSRFLYEMVAGPDKTTAIRAHQKVRPLVEVASYVMESIVAHANAHRGKAFEKAVLTVPAHFGYGQREGVRRAARAVGLEVAAVVNEPTAAAMYFARKKRVSGPVLVFDLGGGTFDASLIEVRESPKGGALVEVLASGGEAFLGGADFDDALAQGLIERFVADTGVDLTEQRVVMQRLQFAAEKAKIALSKSLSTRVRIPFVTMHRERFLDLDYELNRTALERLCAPLVEKTIGICEELLARAQLSAAELAEVVFVGGQTRMPLVRTRVAAALGRKPDTSVHPELSVAVGAALLGEHPDALRDVVSLPISVMTPTIGTRTLLEAGTPVPARARVSLGGRPPAGQPLALGLFESVDEASLERENLGVCKIPPAFLAQNPEAPLELEVEVRDDFGLRVACVAGDARLPLTLQVLPRSRVIRR